MGEVYGTYVRKITGIEQKSQVQIKNHRYRSKITGTDQKSQVQSKKNHPRVQGRVRQKNHGVARKITVSLEKSRKRGGGGNTGKPTGIGFFL